MTGKLIFDVAWAFFEAHRDKGAWGILKLA
jgi:hypothetical protein